MDIELWSFVGGRSSTKFIRKRFLNAVNFLCSSFRLGIANYWCYPFLFFSFFFTNRWVHFNLVWSQMDLNFSRFGPEFGLWSALYPLFGLRSNSVWPRLGLDRWIPLRACPALGAPAEKCLGRVCQQLEYPQEARLGTRGSMSGCESLAAHAQIFFVT